jgi:hypothetical protein
LNRRRRDSHVYITNTASYIQVQISAHAGNPVSCSSESDHTILIVARLKRDGLTAAAVCHWLCSSRHIQYRVSRQSPSSIPLTINRSCQHVNPDIYHTNHRTIAFCARHLRLRPTRYLYGSSIWDLFLTPNCGTQKPSWGCGLGVRIRNTHSGCQEPHMALIQFYGPP